MLTPATFRRRRERLCSILPQGLVVLGGHRPVPMNLPMNLTPKRQSSHILYLTGLQEVDAAILLRLDTGRLELFLPEHEPGDEVWHGPSPSHGEVAEALGADAAYPLHRLEERIELHRTQGAGPLYSLPSADPAWAQRLAALGVALSGFGKLDRNAPDPLADAMIALRLHQDEEGLAEMRQAARVTARAFHAAMAVTTPGVTEAQVRGLIEGVYTANGLRPSYAPIVTIRGEVLHCWSNPNRLGPDDLLLVDSGCETVSGYAADVTRTWPVRGTFSSEQRDIYEIVLEAQLACIDRVRPGVEYLDVHLQAARTIASGLRDLGLLRGSIDDLVEHDAHALFFPHGVGHLIGLDVHDIEDLGDRAGYAHERHRSERFGLAWLRLNRMLEPGMAVTIEPGIYFIPALLLDPAQEARYRGWVDFDRARGYLKFGGIRIEDDVVVTRDEPEVLTGHIPKSLSAIEAAVGASPESLGALGAMALNDPGFA